MRDLTLKFADKADFSAFLGKINWDDNESIQDVILLDVIGYTYTDISKSEEVEVIVKNDGYFVNVRVIEDDFDTSIFDGFVIELEENIRSWA